MSSLNDPGLTDVERRGKSFEDAIVIHAGNTVDGIRQEYEWIERHYGPRDVYWQFEMQKLVQHEGRPFDILVIRLPDGTREEIYFDISEFFGKL